MTGQVQEQDCEQDIQHFHCPPVLSSLWKMGGFWSFLFQVLTQMG